MSSKFAYSTQSGNHLEGLAIGPNEMMVTTSLNQLEQYGLARPSRAARASDKSNAVLREAFELRERIQRRFSTERNNRAKDYASYIKGLMSGTLLGGVPPVTLFTPVAGVVSERGIMLRHNTPIIAIDGETQTEARFILRDQQAETGDYLMKAVLYHGISAEHAGSILHDVNTFAHPISELEVARLNANGSVTQAVSDAIAAVGIHPDALKAKGKPNKSHITSWSKLLAAAVAFAHPGCTEQKGGIGKALERYNKGGNVIDKVTVVPYLIHALKLAMEDREVATSDDRVWAKVAAKCAREGRLISANEWKVISLGGTLSVAA